MPLLTDNLSEKEKTNFHDWMKVRAYVNELTGKRPDINGALYLIGMNEYGTVKPFSKEEKQDLMHIGLCTIFLDVYYTFSHRDEDGWLHFDSIGTIEKVDIRYQENLIKEKIVTYFRKHELIQ